MKKLLALVLALVMTLSLCTISNAAYSDAADVNYKEAVDVMSAVGVFQGSDGKFDPKANLTREQAAKLVAYLDLGASTAEALPAISVFSDVAADRWSSKYIAYCADAGIIDGVGNGKFDPTGALTGYAFAKMLLCVLDYDAATEKMTGSSWQIAVAKLAKSEKIAKSVSSAMSATLTRDEAAQYCFNTIKACPVDHYTGSSTVITVAGVEIKTDAGTAVKSTSQFLKDKYDSKLVLASALEDDFGAPSHKWTYKGVKVGSYTDKAAVVFTAAKNSSKTAQKDAVAEELTAANVVLNSAKQFLDPATNTTYSVKVYKTAFDTNGSDYVATITDVAGLMDQTGNGKQVQVFVDSTNQLITDVVVTSYTVGKVTTLKEYAKTSSGAVYTKYGVTPVNPDGLATGSGEPSGNIYTTKSSANESNTAVVYDGIAKNDYVTYVVANGTLYVYATTKVTGTQTAKASNTLTISGTEYTVGTGVNDNAGTVAAGDFKNTSKDNNYYVDKFGFVVGTNAVETETVYAFIENAETTGTLTKSMVAKLVFTDASTKEVNISKVTVDGTTQTAAKWIAANPTTKDTALDEQMVKYVVDEDGNYEVTVVSNAYNKTSKSIGAGSVTTPTATSFVKNTVWVDPDHNTKATNNATIFVVKTASTTTEGDVVYTAYTGYAAMPTIRNEAAAAKTLKYSYVYGSTTSDENVVKFLFIDASDLSSISNTANSTYVYFLDTDYSVSGTDSKAVYTYTAIKNNELTEVSVSAAANTYVAVGLKKVATVNDDGVITGWATAPTAVTTGLHDAKGGVLNVNGTNYVYDGTEEVVFIDTDDTVTLGTADAVVANNTAKIYVVTNDKTDAVDFTTLYVVLKAEG